MEKGTEIKKVRVRIPPSPTGFMHVATARMALFNYIFAKQNNGAIVLRLEDTDKERSTKEFADDILDGLKWLGLEWDEGPFYQTQRGDIYKKYLQKLLDEDKAYWCFCSPEDLEAEKQYQMSRGEAPIYSGKCAGLGKEQAAAMIGQGRRAVIRFRGKRSKISFNDLARGKIEFDCSLTGDFVIAKDLDTALYNFTVVVDDFEMGITHVIRGEDHISNTPKQILVQEALGFPRPEYAHLPIIFGTDRSKLSKRHGAVGITEYRRQGYLPEAIINFIAFLGWNPGTDKEVYSMAELLQDFSLDKIQKGGAIFNPVRLDYLNGYYIKQYSPEKLAKLCLPHFTAAGFIFEEGGVYKNKQTGEDLDPKFLEKIVMYQQPRLKKLSEIAPLSDYFFAATLDYDKELLKWKDTTAENTLRALDETYNLLSKIEVGEWIREKLEAVIMPRITEFNQSLGLPEKDRGYLLWPLRVSLCGQKMSVGPFEMADVLGKEKTLGRIAAARDLLGGSKCGNTLW
jgi:nondiscriminating glutamyl-tRNA synthetase